MTEYATRPISDLHVVDTIPLPTPAEFEAELPIPPGVLDTVVRGRRAIEEILSGRDERLLLIAGPVLDPRRALGDGVRATPRRPPPVRSRIACWS